MKFADEGDCAQGLVFDGRITEDFKLSSGTWVSVGPLRAQFILACAPLVRDVVLAGRDRNDIGALIFPDLPACRRLCPALPPDAPVEQLLTDANVRARFQELLDAAALRATGGANRIARAMLMVELPTIATGEATDKGSLNCAAVLERRAGLVERLYASSPDPQVLRPSKVSKAP